MAFDFAQVKDKRFIEELKKSPHLLNYVDIYTSRGSPLPLFTEALQAEHKKLKEPNLIYPVTDTTYIHINPHTSSDDGYMEYVIIEPDPPERKIMDVADKMFAIQSADMVPPLEITERFNMIENYLKTNTQISETPVDYNTLGDVYKLKTLPVYKNDWTGLIAERSISPKPLVNNRLRIIFIVSVSWNPHFR